MAKQIECWICGKLHEYCPTCGRSHGWRYVADTIEHYLVYMTIEEFRSGVLSKEQATEMFADKCGVHKDDDLSWMLPNVEQGVREIIGNKATKNVKK